MGQASFHSHASMSCKNWLHQELQCITTLKMSLMIGRQPQRLHAPAVDIRWLQLQSRIVSYFSGILDVRTDRPKIGKRNNLKVRVEGEVITSDEFVDLLEEQKASKEAEKKQ